MSNKKIFLMRPFTDSEEITAIQAVFETKFLTEGATTKEFEEKFASYVSASYGVAVTSCAIGLELALRTLGVGPGDEVIVPSFTHPATGDCVCMVGASPILVDVDISSYNMDPAAFKAAITPATKAVIPVSWGGNPLDPEIYKIAQEHNIPVIEDAACSVGSSINDRKVGSLADMTVFSFHPRKIMTTGEGGMVTCNNEELYDKAYTLKHFGMDKKGNFEYHGNNYKMSNIVSAIGLVQLKKLDNILKDRIQKAHTYTRLLSDIPQVIPPHERPGTRHIYQTYCIYLQKADCRDQVRAKLSEMNIETQIGTYALHLLPSYQGDKKSGCLENSEKLYKNLLALPLHHELTAADQSYVVDSLSKVLKTLN